MWRLPILNLCFLLILITILTLQHSAAVFAPFERSDGSGDPPLGAHRVRGNASSDNGLWTALDYLSELGQRSRIIKDWYLENRTPSWDRRRAAPGVENDLLEARFHVANAAALSAATSDRHRTTTELDRADKCLQKAMGGVGEHLRPFVSAVRGELTQAKRELDTGDPDTDTRDEQIKIDLDAVLQALHGH